MPDERECPCNESNKRRLARVATDVADRLSGVKSLYFTGITRLWLSILLLTLLVFVTAVCGCGSAIPREQSQPDETTTALTVTPNPAPAGEPVTLAASVNTTEQIPSGTVTFLDASEQLGSVSLSSGSASLVVSNFPPNSSHSLTAYYPGSSTLNPSRSTPVTLTIEAAQQTLTTTTLTVTPNPASAESAVSLTATVTSALATLPAIDTSATSKHLVGNQPNEAPLHLSHSIATASQPRALASSRNGRPHDTAESCPVSGGKVNIQDCGADPTGQLDSTAAIAAAHRAICAAGGGEIDYPEGTYSITPSNGNFLTCSNLYEYGTGKLVVSPQTGDFAYIFGPPVGSDIVQDNITFDGLTIDENAINNTTSLPMTAPCSGGTKAPGGPLNCYQFVWSFQGNYDGYVTNLTIRNTTIYSGGVSVLAVSDGNAEGVPSKVTKNITFTNNNVVFEKRSSTPRFDNSALYIDAQGVNIGGNTFTTLHESASDGAGAAMEVHGGPGMAIGNNVDWYKLGGYLANTNGVIWSQNVVLHALDGLALYQEYAMDHNTITSNSFSLNNADRFDPASADTFGIALANAAALSGTVSNLQIANNTIEFQPDTGASDSLNPYNSGGISLFSYGVVENADVEDNIVQNSPVTCINVGGGGSATGINTNILLANNRVIDCGMMPAMIDMDAAIWLDGTLNNIDVLQNDLIFTSNPFRGHYAILGSRISATGGFVADNEVTAVDGTPIIDLSSNMSQTVPALAAAPATGTVTFYDGTTRLGSEPVSGGSATLVVSDFAGSSDHILTASYEGDSANAPSTSAAVPLLILAPAQADTPAGQQASSVMLCFRDDASDARQCLRPWPMFSRRPGDSRRSTPDEGSDKLVRMRP